MNESRAVEFGIEIPTPEAVELVSPVIQGGHSYIGVAIDVEADIEEGQRRLALTEAEARDLHAALGAALTKAPTQS